MRGRRGGIQKDTQYAGASRISQRKSPTWIYLARGPLTLFLRAILGCFAAASSLNSKCYELKGRRIERKRGAIKLQEGGNLYKKEEIEKKSRESRLQSDSDQNSRNICVAAAIHLKFRNPRQDQPQTNILCFR